MNNPFFIGRLAQRVLPQLYAKKEPTLVLNGELEISHWIPEGNVPIPPGSSGSGSPLYTESEKRLKR